MRPRIIPLTIGGTRQVRVGQRLYGVPEGAEVLRVHLGAARTPAAYVRVANQVHLLVARGEVVLPPDIEQAIHVRYFGRRPQQAAQQRPLLGDDPSLTTGQRLARRRRLAAQGRARMST